MADDSMTFGESQQILDAISTLERLEASGEIREAEQKALDNFRGKERAAIQSEADTVATYRGVQADGSFGLADEINGARKAVGDFMRNGDLAKARAAYAKYRDLTREKDKAAELLAPDAFGRGKKTGAVLSALTPAGVATKGMQGMTMLGKMAVGAGTGAATAALPEFAEGEDGFAERLKNVSPVNVAIGAGLGGIAPAAGSAVGGTVRAAQNMRRGVEGFGASASNRVARSMGKSQRSGQDIQAYLDGIGPEGILADVQGAPQKLAQGLASMSGEGSDILQRSIRDRADGAGTRIEDVMTRRIDEPEAAYQARVDLANERTTVFGPMYDAATSSKLTFDVSGIRDQIKGAGVDAASTVSKKLKTVLKDLTKEGPISAKRLHNSRAALSDAIFKAGIKGDGAVVANLRPIIEEMDKMLDNIPDYATARAGYANNKGMERAVEQGRKVFTGGATTAMSPKSLSDALGKMSDAQRDAYKKGAREYISALMGTSSNDAAAAWREFGKNWNAEKLRLIVGNDDAQEITRRLMAEKEFSATRGAVVEGSQTSQRGEAREELSDIRDPESGNAPSPISRIRQGIEAPINHVIDKILFGPRRGVVNREIGQILSLQGDARDRAVKALLAEAKTLNDPTRTQQIVEALTTVSGLTYVQTVGD